MALVTGPPVPAQLLLSTCRVRVLSCVFSSLKGGQWTQAKSFQLLSLKNPKHIKVCNSA